VDPPPEGADTLQADPEADGDSDSDEDLDISDFDLDMGCVHTTIMLSVLLCGSLLVKVLQDASVT
jgi:hypothetical protein